MTTISFAKATIQIKRIIILVLILGPLQAISFAAQFALGRKLIKTRVREVIFPIYCRAHESDIFSILQIFWRNELEIPHLNAARVIIDAGANVGYASLYFANRFSNARVIAIEPDDSNLAILRRNCEACDRIVIVKGALWHRQEPLIIENPLDPKWELRVRPVGQSEDDTAPVGAFTVPDILEMFDLPFVDLIKIDIEGAEKQLFEERTEDWIEKVGMILVETHDRYLPGSSEAVLEAAKKHNLVASRQAEYFLLSSKQRAARAEQSVAKSSTRVA